MKYLDFFCSDYFFLIEKNVLLHSILEILVLKYKFYGTT